MGAESFKNVVSLSWTLIHRLHRSRKSKIRGRHHSHNVTLLYSFCIGGGLLLQEKLQKSWYSKAQKTKLNFTYTSLWFQLLMSTWFVHHWWLNSLDPHSILWLSINFLFTPFIWCSWRGSKLIWIPSDFSLYWTRSRTLKRGKWVW